MKIVKIDRFICDRILTVGCEFTPPRGGVAQILDTYDHDVYEVFNVCVNSKDGGLFQKLFILISSFCRFVFKLFSDKRISIIHIHTASYNSFWRSTFFVKASKLFNKRVILHIHGGDFKSFYMKAPEKVIRVLSMCDVLIVLTESWKMFFQSIPFYGKIEVVRNPVPLANAHLSYHGDGLVHFLYLGLLAKEKGIFDLLEVIASSKEKYEGKLVLHVGGNGDVEKLIRMIDAEGLNKIVRYEGWVSGDHKRELLEKCDFTILPSYAEGLPVCLIEAISYGHYVIASSVGGIPELVTPELGALMIPGDKDRLSHLIDSSLEDVDIIRLKRGERRKAAEVYGTESVAKTLTDLYLKLMSDQ